MATFRSGALAHGFASNLLNLCNLRNLRIFNLRDLGFVAALSHPLMQMDQHQRVKARIELVGEKTHRTQIGKHGRGTESFA